MPKKLCNGINIAFEDYGDRKNPVVLLIQGLNVPCTGWPPTLIEALVAAGYRVLTPDNRDVGHSDILDQLGHPNRMWQFVRDSMQLPIETPYQLEDMALDMIGLLDALDIERAHLVGVSMGGMIAQIMAIAHVNRVASLTSIMSSTNRRGLPGPSKEISDMMINGPTEKTEEGVASFYWKLWRALGSPAYPLPDDELRDFLARVFDRGMSNSGVLRQTTAIIAAASRVDQLAKVKVPVQVIHGDCDPLIPLACGVDTAQAVPGASMHTIEGMGHDLPNALMPKFSEYIDELVRSTMPS